MTSSIHNTNLLPVVRQNQEPLSRALQVPRKAATPRPSISNNAQRAGALAIVNQSGRTGRGSLVDVYV